MITRERKKIFPKSASTKSLRTSSRVYFSPGRDAFILTPPSFRFFAFSRKIASSRHQSVLGGGAVSISMPRSPHAFSSRTPHTPPLSKSKEGRCATCEWTDGMRKRRGRREEEACGSRSRTVFSFVPRSNGGNSSSRSSREPMNRGGDSWRKRNSPSPSLSLIKFFRYTRELRFFPEFFDLDPFGSIRRSNERVRLVITNFDEDSWLFFFASIIPVSLDRKISFLFFFF